MIKPIKKSDVTVNKFKVFKTWHIYTEPNSNYSGSLQNNPTSNQ